MLTAIDETIRRINEVTVCQEHWKLIETRLNRLRQIFNDDRSQTKMAQLLQVIDELASDCRENDTHLYGSTDRDLEYSLNRVHQQLAHLETTFTNDPNQKVAILSDAYREELLLDLRNSDEKRRQEYDAIEKTALAQAIDQLRQLREKYGASIEPYLRSCMELHRSVSLIGLTDDTLAEVAHTSHQITFEQQIQLKRSWPTLKLPLHHSFVQFKSVPHIAHGLPDLTHEKDVSGESILRTNRRIVILGDHGSGKSSFVRWLVRHFAQTLLVNEQHDTDYGPLRIPILIHVGEFAKLLHTQPSLTLFDYIGRHKWMEHTIVDNSPVSVDDLSRALQDYIKHGQALIILDGLDEIPELDRRAKIIRIVKNFVDSYVKIDTSSAVLDDDPAQFSGNQLIVTSRTTAYRATPLHGRFAHYVIRPMDVEQIRLFVDHWFSSLHQHVIDTLSLTKSNKGEACGERLKNELDKPENVELRDVASNCRLLSVLCTLSFNQQDQCALPPQRIRLYEKLANSMLSLWNKRGPKIPMTRLIEILRDVAFYTYEHPTSTSVTRTQIIEICQQCIQNFSDKPRLDGAETRDLESYTLQCVQVVIEDIGFLVGRGQGCFTFLHKAFQEYFTCLKFIKTSRSNMSRFITDQSAREDEIRLTAQSLSRHTRDPHFRIPIAFALSKLSYTWPRDDFDQLCRIFLQEEDEAHSLLPRHVCTLIMCSNDLVNYPSDDIMFDVLDRFMLASIHHRWSIICPFLLDHITMTLKRLSNDTVSLWINRFLSRSPQPDIQTITSLCQLLEEKPHEFENIKWLDQVSCSLLQSLSTLDDDANEFAIDRLLIKVAFSNHQLLPIRANTLKEFFLREGMESSSIPVLLFPLIVILYGGLKRENQTILFDPSRIHRESSAITPMLTRLLSTHDRSKQDQALKKFKQEIIRSLITRIENHDESVDTIDLCIATICLCGIDYVQENRTIIPSPLLRAALSRLKHISRILRQFYFPTDENDQTIEDDATKLVSTAIERFRHGESARVQFLDLLHCLKSNLARLRSAYSSTLLAGDAEVARRVTLTLPNSLRKEGKLLNALLSADTYFYTDRSSCSLLPQFTSLFWISEQDDDFQVQYRVAVACDSIPDYLLFDNDQDVLSVLTFAPAHLQNLYIRLLKQKFMPITADDLTGSKKQHLYFGHILTECLLFLSNPSCERVSVSIASIILLPWLRTQQLDILGSSLLWMQADKDFNLLGAYEVRRQGSLDDTENAFATYEITGEQRRALIEACIDEAYRRFQTAMTANNSHSMQLYSASVTLAHVCRWTDEERKRSLLQESVRGALLITNKLARLDALCVIAFYSHLHYSQISVTMDRSLTDEIEYELNSIYPNSPLLLHAALFLRCLPLLQHQQTIDNCLRNLYSKFDDTDQRDRQAVHEALSPYIQSTSIFSTITKLLPQDVSDENIRTPPKSSALKKYFNMVTNEALPCLVLISNLYLLQVARDLHDCLQTVNDQFTTNEFAWSKLFPFESSTLTEAQALALTNVLQLAVLSEQPNVLDKLRPILNRTLHRLQTVEFKARLLLESWLPWKDSPDASPFAYHAALLLGNSNLWSVAVVSILCDLLACENDRFRHRAELILHSSSENDIRTSSKMGLDVIFVLAKRKVHYQQTCASARLTVYRMLGNITIDNQSHLEAFLWLERYRIHALNNRNYSLDSAKSRTNPYIASYFTPELVTDAISFANLCGISDDLITYLCDMIGSNLSWFLDIDGDTTSNIVCQSHTQFVVSVVTSLLNTVNHTEDTRQIAIEALTNLFDTSTQSVVQVAAAYALGYVCSETTYKHLLEKIQQVMNDLTSDTTCYSNQVLITLMTSYAYCISIHKMTFDQDDLDVFCILLQHSSQEIAQAARTACGRVVKEMSFLCDLLGCNPLQCYHALIESTASLFLYDVQEESETAVVDFIEKHPALLSIFIVQLHNSIRHFTDGVLPMGGVEYRLAYAYPSFVRTASLIALRMPAAFCVAVQSVIHEEDFKRALFYTSKQHNFLQRAACLTILSVFGEFTVELAQMMLQTVYDDPYVRNTCYECIHRIKTIKHRHAVFNLLRASLQCKSMNERYLAVKILGHLVQSLLIPYEQVRTALNDLMLDCHSTEDLWLIEQQQTVWVRHVYYYAGPFRDVVYSLLIQYLTGHSEPVVRRKQLNDIDADFVQSERASRLSSCLYEKRTEESA